MAREYQIQQATLEVLKRGVYAASIGEEKSTGGSNFPAATGEGLPVSAISYEPQDGEDPQSLLGSLIWSDLRLRYDDIDIYFDTVLFNVSQAKNIVTTSVQGRDGTIKEYISDGDYEIDVRLLIVNDQSKIYPVDRVNDVIALLRIKDSLEAISPFLQAFNIFNVVVTDYRALSREGFMNTQPFEINMISDNPIELVEDDQTFI
jgi:hypothetical protein